MLGTMRVWVFLFISAVSLALPAAAEETVYKWVGPDGEVVYSDEPREGAEEVRIEPLQTYHPQQLPRSRPKPTPKRRSVPYTEFAVTSPANNATIRGVTGSLEVKVTSSPALQSGHRITFYLDGQVVGGPGTASAVQLKNVNRGSHIVQAAITNRDGKEVARTNAVTVHIHRAFRK